MPNAPTFLGFALTAAVTLLAASAVCVADAMLPQAQAELDSLYHLAKDAKSLPAGSDQQRAVLEKLATKCDAFTATYGDQMDALLLMAASAIEADDNLFGSLAGERIQLLPFEKTEKTEQQKAGAILAMLTQKGWLQEGFLRKRLLETTDSADKTRASWACLWLGRSDETGLGGNADLEDAAKWYEKAVQLGNTDASADLARLHSVSFADLSASAQLEIVLLNKNAAHLSELPDSDRPTHAIELFAKIKHFNVDNPDYAHGWILQADLALFLHKEIEGRYAADQLIRLGIRSSTKPEVIDLMERLAKAGWCQLPIEQPSTQPTGG